MCKRGRALGVTIEGLSVMEIARDIADGKNVFAIQITDSDHEHSTHQYISEDKIETIISVLKRARDYFNDTCELPLEVK